MKNRIGQPLKGLLVCGLLALAPWQSRGVIFSVDWGGANLYEPGGGTMMQQGRLVVLVASTGDTQFPDTLSAGWTLGLGDYWTSGDDRIVGRTTVGTGWGSDGGFLQSLSNLELAENTPVKMYWFPSLDSGATALSAGDKYGEYRSDSTLYTVPDNLLYSDPWIAPATSGTFSWALLTSLQGGQTPESGGQANWTVVPEPSVYGWATGGACLAAAFLRRSAGRRNRL